MLLRGWLVGDQRSDFNSQGRLPLVLARANHKEGVHIQEGTISMRHGFFTLLSSDCHASRYTFRGDNIAAGLLVPHILPCDWTLLPPRGWSLLCLANQRFSIGAVNFAFRLNLHQFGMILVCTFRICGVRVH